MTSPNAGRRRRILNSVSRPPSSGIAVLATTAALLAGCSAAHQATPASGGPANGDAEACTHVDAPIMEIPTASSAEPLLRIPLPAGWERSPEHELDLPTMTSYTLLDSDSMAPQNVATVSLGRLPESADDDPQEILDGLQSDMAEQLEAQGMPTAYVSISATVCGLPARKYSREAAGAGLGGSASTGRTATAIHVIAKQDEDVYWAQVVVGVQPGNPEYARDAETILNGFQVLPPTTGG